MSYVNTALSHGNFMDALIHSLTLIAVAEIGDKTQILSIILAAKFRRFWPIFLGVFVATLLNHAFAAYFGSLLASFTDNYWLKIGTATTFIVIGLWLLIPDKAPKIKELKYGAFVTSAVTFFIAEMGDKTQLATISLGAQYSPLWQIIVGTTLGMLIANIPAILCGEKLLQKIPLKSVRIIACVLFIGFGIYGLLAA